MRVVAYGAINIDKTTPASPTVTANDRIDNVWMNDTSTIISVVDPSSAAAVSPRYFKYCMDSANTCVPNSTTKPNTSNLADGMYYYKTRTCTQS